MCIITCEFSGSKPGRRRRRTSTCSGDAGGAATEVEDFCSAVSGTADVEVQKDEECATVNGNRTASTPSFISKRTGAGISVGKVPSSLLLLLICTSTATSTSPTSLNKGSLHHSFVARTRTTATSSLKPSFVTSGRTASATHSRLLASAATSSHRRNDDVASSPYSGRDSSPFDQFTIPSSLSSGNTPAQQQKHDEDHPARTASESKQQQPPLQDQKGKQEEDFATQGEYWKTKKDWWKDPLAMFDDDDEEEDGKGSKKTDNSNRSTQITNDASEEAKQNSKHQEEEKAHGIDEHNHQRMSRNAEHPGSQHNRQSQRTNGQITNDEENMGSFRRTPKTIEEERIIQQSAARHHEPKQFQNQPTSQSTAATTTHASTQDEGQKKTSQNDSPIEGDGGRNGMSRRGWGIIGSGEDHPKQQQQEQKQQNDDDERHTGDPVALAASAVLGAGMPLDVKSIVSFVLGRSIWSSPLSWVGAALVTRSILVRIWQQRSMMCDSFASWSGCSTESRGGSTNVATAKRRRSKHSKPANRNQQDRQQPPMHHSDKDTEYEAEEDRCEFDQAGRRKLPPEYPVSFDEDSYDDSHVPPETEDSFFEYADSADEEDVWSNTSSNKLPADKPTSSRKGKAMYTAHHVDDATYGGSPSSSSAGGFFRRLFLLNADQQGKMPSTKQLMQQLAELTERYERAEHTKSLVEGEYERTSWQLQEAENELSSLKQTTRYLQAQLRDNEEMIERVVKTERRKAKDELARLKEAMVKVVEREREAMRNEFMKQAAELEEMITILPTTSGNTVDAEEQQFYQDEEEF